MRVHGANLLEASASTGSRAITTRSNNSIHILSNTQHEYFDYAGIPAREVSARSTRAPGAKPPSFSFPSKLHRMVEVVSEDEKLSKIVSWQEHGRCFKIHNKDAFVEHVLPETFDQSKYSSFQRQLNMYDFKRLTIGKDKGGYYHMMFLRTRHELAREIKSVKIKGQGPRKPADELGEPNFYVMSYMPYHPSDNVDLPVNRVLPPLCPRPTPTTATMAKTEVASAAALNEDDSQEDYRTVEAPLEEQPKQATAVPLQVEEASLLQIKKTDGLIWSLQVKICKDLVRMGVDPVRAVTTVVLPIPITSQRGVQHAHNAWRGPTAPCKGQSSQMGLQKAATASSAITRGIHCSRPHAVTLGLEHSQYNERKLPSFTSTANALPSYLLTSPVNEGCSGPTTKPVLYAPAIALPPEVFVQSGPSSNIIGGPRGTVRAVFPATEPQFGLFKPRPPQGAQDNTCVFHPFGRSEDPPPTISHCSAASNSSDWPGRDEAVAGIDGKRKHNGQTKRKQKHIMDGAAESLPPRSMQELKKTRSAAISLSRVTLKNPVGVPPLIDSAVGHEEVKRKNVTDAIHGLLQLASCYK